MARSQARQVIGLEDVDPMMADATSTFGPPRAAPAAPAVAPVSASAVPAAKKIKMSAIGSDGRRGGGDEVEVRVGQVLQQPQGGDRGRAPTRSGAYGPATVSHGGEGGDKGRGALRGMQKTMTMKSVSKPRLQSQARSCRRR